MQEKKLTSGNFSSHLAALMAAREVNARELAGATGITPAALSRYLSGQRQPRYEEAAKIAQFFGLPTDHLLQPEKHGAAAFAARLLAVRTPRRHNSRWGDGAAAFAARLLAEMAGTKITRAELARRTGISAAAMQFYAAGTMPPRDDAEKIAAVFGLTAVEMMAPRAHGASGAGASSVVREEPACYAPDWRQRALAAEGKLATITKILRRALDEL